ncbi:MAG: hypothetical protein AN485_24275, partial [Anabaena sp. MDT14b]
TPFFRLLVAPRGGEQLFGIKYHDRSLFPALARPLGACVDSGLDGHVHQRRRCLVVRGQHVLVIAGHTHRAGIAGVNAAPTDDDGNVDLLRGHGVEARLQSSTLRGTGGVVAYRLVNRRRHTARTVESSKGHRGSPMDENGS